MLDYAEYLKIFTALLAVLNPFGAIPMFLTITGQDSHRDRNRIARTVALAVAITLTVTALIGERILTFFGISIASFQVGGSILLLLMAISMMHAKESKSTPEETKAAKNLESVAVVPLAIPLLAGPGTISTVIIYAHLSSSPVHLALIILCVLLAAFVTWVVLRAASRLGSFLGQLGLNIAGRIMGLLLAAIAVEFFTKGIVKLLPGLA